MISKRKLKRSCLECGICILWSTSDKNDSAGFDAFVFEDNFSIAEKEELRTV